MKFLKHEIYIVPAESLPVCILNTQQYSREGSPVLALPKLLALGERLGFALDQFFLKHLF